MGCPEEQCQLLILQSTQKPASLCALWITPSKMPECSPR
jgi:hypothetical protein